MEVYRLTFSRKQRAGWNPVLYKYMICFTHSSNSMNKKSRDDECRKSPNHHYTKCYHYLMTTFSVIISSYSPPRWPPHSEWASQWSPPAHQPPPRCPRWRDPPSWCPWHYKNITLLCSCHGPPPVLLPAWVCQVWVPGVIVGVEGQVWLLCPQLGQVYKLQGAVQH